MRVLRSPIRRRSWKGTLGGGAAVTALAGAGVGIAAGFGAFGGASRFNGISAARHPPTAADKLGPGVANPLVGLVEDGSVRLVAQLGDGVRIYAAASKTGQLCEIDERLPPNGKGGSGGFCGPPLTRKWPITISSYEIGGSSFNLGITLDDVTALSFRADGQNVTVPVKNNAWVYQGKKAVLKALPLTVHFADGSTGRDWYGTFKTPS